MRDGEEGEEGEAEGMGDEGEKEQEGADKMSGE